MSELALRSQTLETVSHNLAGQLAPRSQRAYANDLTHFAAWLSARDLSLETVTRFDMIEYRSHLATSYAKASAARMLVVARRALEEAQISGMRVDNPAKAITGFKADNETPHTALTAKQARAMLTAIDTNTLKGKRDYALVLLLLKTGLRRSEAAALTIGDFSEQQGHNVLTVQHGKGDKRRVVKVQVDVLRAVMDYLEATNRKDEEKIAALFVQFRRGDKPATKGMSEEAIEDVVHAAGLAVDVDITPHSLRATFITLGLEGGARIDQIQYVAGHNDPRTTQRYQTRKLNLDDNGTDYVRF